MHAPSFVPSSFTALLFVCVTLSSCGSSATNLTADAAGMPDAPDGPRDSAAATDAGAAEAGVSGNRVTVSRYIVVDQFGYLPDMKKVAVLADPEVGWNAQDSYTPSPTLELRRFDTGAVVFAGPTTSWRNGEVQANAGDRGAWFDFSSATEPGSYYVYDPGHDIRSHRFDIGKAIYRDVLKAAVRMYYFNRANFAKKRPYACVAEKCWELDADHVGPLQDREARSVLAQDDATTARDLSGGWWDAGDLNKYVTNARSVSGLFTAYLERPSAFRDDYGIPESGNGIPDLVDELRYEMEWVKKMQPADLGGGVLIKVGDLDHPSGLPDQMRGPRYYYPIPCSASTISGAMLFAQAALVYRTVPALAAEAADLERRALAAWDYTERHGITADCDNGVIKAGDSDMDAASQQSLRVAAAAYLFALTADARFESAFRQNLSRTRSFREDGWGMYEPEVADAVMYYASLPRAAADLTKLILDRRKALIAGTDVYLFRPELDLYRAYMRDSNYHWGSNAIRANIGNAAHDLVTYALVSEDQMASARERSSGLLHSFHGVNPLQLVYLTNMYAYGAETSANEMYHTWFHDGTRYDSALTSELGPAPGYVVGGPNASYCDAYATHPCYTSPLASQPAQKAYLDFNTSWDPTQVHDKSWEISEPSIGYQASYIKLLSKFVE